MDEGVLPADHVAGRPPPGPEGHARLGDEHGLEAGRLVAVRTVELELVEALEVECERRLAAVDLPLQAVAMSEREPGRLDRADRTGFELCGGLDRIVDLPSRDERASDRGDRGDLAHEEAGEIDHVRAEVAERARAGLVGVETPGVERRVVAPVLQVAAPEVPDLSELARLDHLARHAHRRHEAVVEGAHVLHACSRHLLPDLEALVRSAAERLLAEDVLPVPGCRDRRRGVHAVRAVVVEQADARVGDELAPVSGRALVAVAVRCSFDRLRVPARDRDEPRHERRRPRHVRERPVRVRVRLAHERVAEHADADLTEIGRGGDLRGGSDAALRSTLGGHHALLCIALSKTTADGAKSVRRTNASASCAPHSRSMPESSHSIERGPV